ncbi:MAG: hypothetical protein OEX01_09540 [Candidatus Bathyarchaeota archaeon]|nr:hypothetical protein [Candidatus Bathyarchaeota archaeon]
MKPVSTILTLRILLLPILSIVIVSVLVIYVYRTSFDASAILDFVSALVSMILVNLLVWERLRDSLSKKLEYIHENFLDKLNERFQRDIFHFWREGIDGMKSDLERYGRFMGISLYPKALLKQIETFLIIYKKYDSKREEIINIGKKDLESQFDQYLWFYLLGLRDLKESYLRPMRDRTSFFKLHEEKASIVKKKQAELIAEIKNHSEECEKIQVEILAKLEDFLLTNHLSLELKLL